MLFFLCNTHIAVTDLLVEGRYAILFLMLESVARGGYHQDPGTVCRLDWRSASDPLHHLCFAQCSAIRMSPCDFLGMPL